MEGHGIRMMAKVFGGMIKKIMFGDLVRPLQKEIHYHMLNCIMMEDVFQKYLTKNGNLVHHPVLTILIGMMLETKSKSDVALNQ